jgi:hypothetical protein
VKSWKADSERKQSDYLAKFNLPSKAYLTDPMILLLIHQAAVGADNNHRMHQKQTTKQLLYNMQKIYIEITLTSLTLFKMGPMYGKTRDTSGCIQPGEFFIA